MHSYKHFIGFLRRGSNNHLPRSIRDRIHGFDTVHHQIKNHLLQLDSIAQYRRIIVGQVHSYRHSFSHRVILHQNDDFLNGLVNVEAHSLGIGFLYECSNARDHLTGPIAVAENAAHGVPRFIEIWGRCGKPAQKGIGVCDDGGERLVDFMSNGGSHLAQSCHPRNVG